MNPQHTILIVDDNASTRIALERVLNHHGYAVRVFDDPARFIESIDPSYGYAHCAILDMRIPRRNRPSATPQTQLRGPRCDLSLSAGHTCSRRLQIDHPTVCCIDQCLSSAGGGQ